MRTLKPAKGVADAEPVVADTMKEPEAVIDFVSFGTDGFKWSNAFAAAIAATGMDVASADNAVARLGEIWFANAITAGHDTAWSEAFSAGKEQGAAEALASAPLYDPAVILSDDVKEIRFTREQLIELRAGAFNEGKAASFSEHADAINLFEKIKAFNSAVAATSTEEDDERINVAISGFGFEPVDPFKNMFLVHPASVSALISASFDNGKAAALADIPTLRGPTVDDPPTHGEVFKIDGVAWSHHIDAAKKAGRDEHLRAGLNDTGDVPVLDLFEANAVEFEIDQTNKIWLNVDGRMRTRIGHANIIVLIDTNNRTVLRSPSVADREPTTVAERVGDQDGTQDR